MTEHISSQSMLLSQQMGRHFVENAAIPRLGIEFPDRLSFDNWILVGRRLSTVYASSAWCLGDWLVHGESMYPGRYRDAIEFCSLNHQTLRNYAWVARHVPMSRRRDTVSFGHHAEVAALPEHEQNYWLRRAEELGWARSRLRSEVRSSRRQREALSATPWPADRSGASPEPSAGGPGPVEHMDVQLKISSVQFASWRAAAADADLSVADWVTRQLNDAAGVDRSGQAPRGRSLADTKVMIVAQKTSFTVPSRSLSSASSVGPSGSDR